MNISASWGEPSVTNETARVSRLSEAERQELRRFCRRRLNDPATAASAKETLAALDALNAEHSEAERTRKAAEAARISSLAGEARMLAEMAAERAAREERDRKAREAMTPDYIVSKLLETVGVLVAMPVGWFIGELALGHIGGMIFPFALAGIVIWAFAQHRSRNA
jgi:hypothetical protein